MFPLYDTVRSHKFPIINLTLIAANVLAFLYETQMDESTLQGFIFTWGLIPSHFLNDPSSAWINILTSMFLHGGWFHIINNMWVLFIFGDNVEGSMGSIRYLIFYLLGGTAAGLLQTYVLPASTVPMIGASGAVAGVLGAYLILFPRSRIASLVPILFIFTLIEVPAFIFLLFWFASQLFSGLFAIQGAGESGIAWWAHVGGFIFGVVMVSFFAIKRRTISVNHRC
jgi:membrane associated rhomboid family serine protease